MSRRNSPAMKARRRAERKQHAAVVETGKDVVSFTPETWEKITDIPGLPAYLLEVTERHGRPGVIKVLAEYGLEVVPETP